MKEDHSTIKIQTLYRTHSKRTIQFFPESGTMYRTARKFMLVIFDNSKSTVSSCDIVKKIEREIGLNG